MIAINGFGRIGRAVFRIAFDSLKISVINHPRGIEDAYYLLKYDSVYGKFPHEIKIDKDFLIIKKRKIRIISERDPSKIKWKTLGVKFVVESTGAFRDRAGASKHLDAGAEKVIVTAPMKIGKPDVTLVLGVNDTALKKSHKIISVASCTTNCLTPLVKVLNDNFKIQNGFFTTTHAYTSSQNLVDGSARKPSRGRSAALNIVPTTTGASQALFEVLPSLKGKISGIAMRVPVPSGSIVDLTVNLKKQATPEKINAAFLRYSKKFPSILSCISEPIVSSDIIGDSHSAIFILDKTDVIGKTAKVLAWYDNEFGYSNRVVDVLKKII